MSVCESWKSVLIDDARMRKKRDLRRAREAARPASPHRRRDPRSAVEHKPLYREQIDRQRRPAVEREIGDGFADDGTELVAVTGEAAGDDDAAVRWVVVDDEVLVGR